MKDSLPYPHHANHQTKIVSIYFESGYPATMATAYLAKSYYPGYIGRIVSRDELDRLLDQPL